MRGRLIFCLPVRRGYATCPRGAGRGLSRRGEGPSYHHGMSTWLRAVHRRVMLLGVLAASVTACGGEVGAVPVDASAPVVDAAAAAAAVPDAAVVADASPTIDASASKCGADGRQWGRSPTQRCCNDERLDFSLPEANTRQHCGVCGRKCLDATECVRSKQGYYFCVGCGLESESGNERCETNCCSHSYDDAAHVDAPYIGRGICTASDCAGKCSPGNCPAESVCINPTSSSMPCVYQ